MDVSYLTAGIRVSKSIGADTHSQNTQPHARLPAMAQQPQYKKTMTTKQRHEKSTKVNMDMNSCYGTINSETLLN